MSSMKPFNSKFESVDSIINYLREPSPPEVVSSSTTSSAIGSITINNGLKSTKKQKKEKELANVMKTTQANSEQNVQVLASGRIR
jgi:DNA replication protein DnaD